MQINKWIIGLITIEIILHLCEITFDVMQHMHFYGLNF